MSMNLYVEAKLECIIAKTGETIFTTDEFDLYQTPTKITYKLLAENNTLEAYCDWVLSLFEDEEIDVYEPEDFLHKKSPIGKRVVNYGKDHVKELKEWYTDLEDKGYKIEFFYM